MSISALEPISYTHELLTEEFSQSISQIHKENKTLHAKIDIPKKEASKLIQLIHAGASERFPFIILGKGDLRTDPVLINNFGTTSTDPSIDQKTIKTFFQTVNPDMTSKVLKQEIVEHLTVGAILKETNWYPFKNDCFIYGAIQNCKEFHLKFRRSHMSEDLLWDNKEQRPTVLGREIIMVMLSGYHAHDTKYGMILMPPCKGTLETHSATLTEYRQKIQEIGSAKELLALFD